MMVNTVYEMWLESTGYFDALAILSEGPLHPDRIQSNSKLASTLEWKGIRTLDIGGGTGWSHRFFKSLGAAIYSVEPNEWMRYVATQGGVDNKEIFPISSNELTSDWFGQNGEFDRLLLQGVIGFLPGGLQTVQRIFKDGGFSSLVIVDWVGKAEGCAGAKILSEICTSDLTRLVENIGLTHMKLEVSTYVDNRSLLTIEDLWQRTLKIFPEGFEIGRKSCIAEKWKRSLDIAGPIEKRYATLISY